MFFSNRFQQVELNGQCFSWSSGPAGVQHSSILGQLLFLYVNDLPDSLQFAAKLFWDDISLFSNVYDPIISAGQLDSDLKKKSHWAYKWKMTFNPGLSKRHTKLYFSDRVLQ